MILYVESRAILAALLGESDRDRIQLVLDGAERVFTSTVTVIECSRGIIRAGHGGRITTTEALALAKALDEAERRWLTVMLDDRIVARAREPFPADPVRSLDAIHLATAVVLRESLGAVHLLSLDERIRANAEALGMVVQPFRR